MTKQKTCIKFYHYNPSRSVDPKNNLKFFKKKF